jgi:inhibitor of KinA
MKAIAYGPNAILLQFAAQPGDAALARSLAFVEELEKNPPVGMTEVTPALTTLLVEFNPKERIDAPPLAHELIARLKKIPCDPLPKRSFIEVPLVYNGSDLERVARFHDLSVREVVEFHGAPVYHVAMIGFSPGFPYLAGLDPRLHTPRLDSPRPQVQAGSVAIGGEHAGIYSIDTPGGWNIIGHTSLKIFDPERGAVPGCEEAMFLLEPGDRVKFIPHSS